MKFEVKSEVKDEVKLEVKRQTSAETKGKGLLLGRNARFLGGNASETWFLRGYRQEGFLSCVEKAASFGENLQYLFNSCEEMFVSCGGRLENAVTLHRKDYGSSPEGVHFARECQARDRLARQDA